MECKTLWQHILAGLARARARRPVSFYLLLLIPVALVLGARMGEVRDNPREFVFYLTAGFVFFFVLMCRAISDFFDISRSLFRERERLFQSAFGDEQFLAQMAQKRRNL